MEKVYPGCFSGRLNCMLAFSFYCSVVAFVYSGILTKPGEVFDFVPGLVVRLTSRVWIHKVTFYCEKCIAGQIAFWAYLVSSYQSYNPFTHVVVVSLSILMAAFFHKLWQKI